MVEIEQEIENIESWDPSGGGKLVAGIYEVEIAEVKVEDAKSGYPKLNMKCKVVSGDHMGSTCFVDRSLHPNALGYFRGMLDMLNLFATGRSFDEKKLVGRFMRVQMVDSYKADGVTPTLKSERLFRSEVNDHKNEQADISEGATTVPAARVNGNGNGKAAAAKPAAKPVPATRPAARPPAAAGKKADDDLPF